VVEVLLGDRAVVRVAAVNGEAVVLVSLLEVAVVETGRVLADLAVSTDAAPVVRFAGNAIVHLECARRLGAEFGDFAGPLVAHDEWVLSPLPAVVSNFEVRAADATGANAYEDFAGPRFRDVDGLQLQISGFV
jgi:hypothetical protein